MGHELDDAKRSAERVGGQEGTWAKFFNSLNLGNFTPEKYKELLKLFEDYYGSFHEEFIGGGQSQLLVELGIGSGISALPLVERGFKVIGIDNDVEALNMCKSNATNYSSSPENLKLVQGDLYNPDWHKQFCNKGVAACVSYGVLEHFEQETLDLLVQQQLEIASLLIAVIPVNTPQSLIAFEAAGDPNGDVDSNGIFRRFLKEETWDEIFVKNGGEIVRKFNIDAERLEGIAHIVVYAVKRKDRILSDSGS